jgi:hypothetical protein
MPYERQLLRCNIESVRQGWLVRPQITLCLGIEGCKPPESDYEHLLGAGLLNGEEYRKIADRLNGLDATPGDIGRVFDVKCVSLCLGGTERPYKFASSKPGPGHVVLTYVLEEDRLPTRAGLKLNLSSVISSKHGWYVYRARRTIIQRLTVRLTAQFQIAALKSGLWWCDPQRHEVPVGDRNWTSTLSVPGPIPVGTELFWMLGIE